MTGPRARTSDALEVRTHRRALPDVDPLGVYLAARDHYGAGEVYLLESAAGPAGDCRQHVVGFDDVLSVSVSRGRVRVEGLEPLRSALLSRLTPLLAPGAELPVLRADGMIWDLVRTAQSLFDVDGSAGRFEFGFLAYLGYDLAHYIEDLPRLIDDGPDVPDLHLVLYRGRVHTDLDTGATELVLHEGPGWPGPDPDRVAAWVAAATDTPPDPADFRGGDGVDDDTERHTYLEHVDRCLGHIAVGDIYQVQIGHELTIRSEADPVAVYRRLRERNASPYMYLAAVDGHTVVGASPELFVRSQDGEVVMRPIAGTARRDGSGDDSAVAALLSSDPKEIAEHIMLVDLCRNDIGRICRKDTLEVREQLQVERYSHVLHLVSTVVGQADDGVDTSDVIAALFPSGTMTGAPKIRAMEIIEELESRRRGLYAGALGLLDVGGYLDLALCIRTLVHHDGAYRTRASAGIVADSDGGREWTETQAKSGAAYWAVTGGELL